EKEGILIGFGDKAPLLAASARIWPTSGPTVPLGEAMLCPGDNPVILGRRDTHGRFSAASDSARDLQHHRLPDARRVVHRSIGEADINVGCGMDGDAQRRAARAR